MGKKKKSILNPDGTYVNLIKEKKEFDSPPSGNQFSKCSRCGERFEQFLIEDQNRYTAFKTCPKCRKKKKTNETDTITVTLDYTPHPAQQKFHNSNARFRVLDCGSRFGKDRCSTMESIDYFLKCLNEDRPTSMIPSVYWWIIAPTERMAKQNWNELKKYFPRDLIEEVSNAGMSMQTKWGGLIEVRSAYDPESLVGVGLDLVTITEAARIADLDIVWANLEQRLNSPGRGLKGKGGIGIINSSPKGRNYFYKMWTWGQKNHADYDPDWESWKFSTWDNPEMAVKGNEIKYDRHGRPVTYKERLKRRLGKRRYNQDIMADFLGDNTNCFPDFESNCVVRVPYGLNSNEKADFLKDWRNPKPYKRYLIGYDPARISDMPPLVVVDEDTGYIVRIVNMSGKNWNGQYDTIAYYSRMYNHASVVFSKTGHETIAEELEKRGISVITLNEQGANKENLVTNLERVVQESAMKVLDDGSDEASMLIAQFNDYSQKNKNDKTTYGNVEEAHDDYVSACYVVYSQINKADISTPPYVGIMAGV